MDEQQLRAQVHEMLTMNAAPHQPPRDPLSIANAIGFDDDHRRDLLVRLVREEADKLHINML
jgi:hypothetical protein